MYLAQKLHEKVLSEENHWSSTHSPNKLLVISITKQNVAINPQLNGCYNIG
jgi:hypothetical protein